jgi:hypothetical protein
MFFIALIHTTRFTQSVLLYLIMTIFVEEYKLHSYINFKIIFLVYFSYTIRMANYDHQLQICASFKITLDFTEQAKLNMVRNLYC